ncbi:SRPBCC family protein [Variovorax sp. 22077]|uniref:SRPBCC family protein n=1 Tax=Variovorax sp. 22077 TaxID=3453867 RepID=UPI00104C2C58
MAHRRFEFDMPAPADVVFDAFHYHVWRARWDSLVGNARVVGGAPCPFVGAETENTGHGWLRGLSMRTRFVSFDRPHVAAASMVGRSFPFSRWAASMRHRDVQPGHSVLIYVYTIEAGPKALRWLLEPVVAWVFAWQTRRRFARLHAFLATQAHEVVAWQHAERGGSAT